MTTKDPRKEPIDNTQFDDGTSKPAHQDKTAPSHKAVVKEQYPNGTPGDWKNKEDVE
jgi:deferrochelatase/peroxidase EfeB